ncbi:hypothetical protein ZWY2020_051932 [Hordeum vulgare]|nr:hypothetical protein ZWY2020_051932 [Hordeum vulgare]
MRRNWSWQERAEDDGADAEAGDDEEEAAFKLSVLCDETHAGLKATGRGCRGGRLPQNGWPVSSSRSEQVKVDWWSWLAANHSRTATEVSAVCGMHQQFSPTSR